MQVFVTGASGWIGSAVIPELRDAGHGVVGLARSDAAATRIAGLGAQVLRGELADTGALAAAAETADGVIHLGYRHDFSRVAEAAAMDAAAVAAIGAALEGTGKPLVVAGGVAGLSVDGRPAAETDMPDPALHPRTAAGNAVLELSGRGVRSALVRFAPTVHGAGDHGFIAVLVGIARERGYSAFIGDGTNRWPAVHRSDAGALVARVLDDAPGGRAWHAVGEEGVPTRDIAAAIGHGLGLAVESVPADRAAEHFGWIGMFFGADWPASSAVTRRELDWAPTGPTLLEDLAAGDYFKAA